MDRDYSILKKNYGEKFAKLCRKLFPTILETEGLLSKVILSKFSPNHFLYDDIINNNYVEYFKEYIYSFIDIEKDKPQTNKSVKELLSDVGYDFYECNTEEEIQKFKKYYRKDEEICTFQGGRLKRNHVFWAVKKDVDKIKREKVPKRDDPYGKSVISIQFTKQGNFLLITNRYNHHVKNSDSTFGGNLENINKGLTYAFEKEYGLKINQNPYNIYGFSLENYICADNDKWYRYNYELNNIYYCPNNVIIDKGKPKQLDKSRFILVDYFIIDLKNKTIKLYDKEIEDNFIDEFNNIDKIEIHNNETGKNIIIKLKNKEYIIIKTNKFNQIIEITDNNIKHINDKYLNWNTTITKLELPNLKTIRDWFMPNNKELEEINLPNLTKIGDFFLISNEKISIVTLPKLESIGYYFLNKNEKISKYIYSQLKENNTEKTNNKNR